MPFSTRRNFLKLSGLGFLPTVLPAKSFFAQQPSINLPMADEQAVKFYGDGETFEPAAYIDTLQKLNNAVPIVRDRYGEGGAIAFLEKKMEEITGKEKAIFMPSGTLSNQLAISVLSGSNTKIYVQDTSHVYRDEADAAQSVYQKRLMPLAKGATCFTAAMLQQAIESLGEEEVFKSGVGAVSIENPVRRTDGRMVPIDEIKKISNYCRANNIKLHLDGARIFMASAWSGISIKEYASYFDTIYISLYKYLGAAAGAVLCGDKTTMEKMSHLVKIHGGSMYGNWTNAAMALHRLDGFENRLQQAILQSVSLFEALNKIPGISIKSLKDGTNMYELKLDPSIDGTKFQTSLREKYNVRIPRPDKNNFAFISINETLLYKDNLFLEQAFKKSLEK